MFHTNLSTEWNENKIAAWQLSRYNSVRFSHCSLSTMSDSDHLLPPPVPDSVSETVQFVQPPDASTLVANLLPTGTRMGHYVVKKYIGGGGMGNVYLATDEALDRDVAIKVLTQQRASDQGTVARFMNEAKSAARLNHEHIAQVYFAGDASGTPFIAFEYVEGINVRTMVEDHDVFPLPQALSYLLQIAHALAHATTHGVVHRDVKPSNILITHEGRAKLIDMGLARLLDTAEGRGDLTASGVTLGTFDYISPEQARDPRNADIRSDIYSLGCTFFFMLAGRPPFPEGTVLQKLLQHQGDAPPDIRSFQPTIPGEVAFLIQKMMAKDPRQRFQTPAVLIEALTDVARRLGLRPAGQGSLVWTPVRQNRTSLFLRHMPWMAAVSLLFVGVLLTAFLEPSEPLSIPESTSPSPPISVPITNADVPPTEPIRTPTTPFDVVFVSFPAVRSSQTLAAPVSGGRLQPVMPGTGRLAAVANGTLNVTDFRPVTQSPAGQRATQVSQTWCVDPSGITIGAYPSIASALTASALTDTDAETVIQLKWKGALRVLEPIRLDQRKIKFIAAEGHDPIVLFEPTELQRSLFTVFSSNLEFERVGIDIRLTPSVRLTDWSLFDLAGNVQLVFEQCCLTIQNRLIFDNYAYHNDVVFFRNRVPASSEGTTNTEDTVFEPLTIEVKDSLLRGEAVAIQSDISQDMRIRFTNSLVALAKPFILLKENRRAVGQTLIQIRWQKVAFFGRQEVVDLQKETNADSMFIDFDAQQSVVVLNRSPFAVFRGGFQSQENVLDDFYWSGMEIYLHGVTGLRFHPSSLLTDEMSLEDWQEHWSIDTDMQTRTDTLTLTETTKPMSRYAPLDIQTLFGSQNVPIPTLDELPTRWFGAD